MKTFTALFGIFAVASASAATVSYDGYKAFHVPFANKQVADIFAKFADKWDLNTWKHTNEYADVLVPPSQLGAFQQKFSGLAKIESMYNDLTKALEAESNFAPYEAGTANISYFNSYHSHSDHMTFLKDLQSQYSSHSAITSTGRSLEGRDLTGIHIYGASKGKTAILFHGTVHAREWISAMVVEYIAWYLLSNYNSNNEVKAIMDKYDIFIFPFVNPDGFVYTSSDRFWRKNRSSNNGNNCKGTDVNRNWPHQWTGSGSSTNPCAETYRGTAQGSEPETKGISAFMNNLVKSQGVKLYIDWHSYGKYILSPYGYTSSQAPRHAEHIKFGNGAAAALKAVHGQSFTVGPTSTTLYGVNGASTDYAIDVSKVTYAYTVELRGGNGGGTQGFVLPPEQIKPSGEESWAAVKYWLQNI